MPISFNHILVSINTALATLEFEVEKKTSDHFTFDSDEVKMFVVEFLAEPDNVNKELQVTVINLKGVARQLVLSSMSKFIQCFV